LTSDVCDHTETCGCRVIVRGISEGLDDLLLVGSHRPISEQFSELIDQLNTLLETRVDIKPTHDEVFQYHGKKKAMEVEMELRRRGKEKIDAAARQLADLGLTCEEELSLDYGLSRNMEMYLRMRLLSIFQEPFTVDEMYSILFGEPECPEKEVVQSWVLQYVKKKVLVVDGEKYRWRYLPQV